MKLFRSENENIALITILILAVRAKYIVRNLSVTFNHPNDMDVSFICRGTSEDYKPVKNDKTSEEYSYKGLILPRQGYIVCTQKELIYKI